ncbi:multiheme c-type cytochrome [Thalassotalea fonticola]|uniref:Multiheme c-type cytochrome n=1 Tax=Thalassotalea fonticola TaxID=3065649 RepID=A0ABZ0GUG8_9GAMM|nr:multiheme c-type cytochrome [Colwelliaceae bacterium S1-1]
MHTFNSFFKLSFFILAALNLAVSFDLSASENQACIDCHQEQTTKWQQSDHAKSMAVASKDSVVGNFDKQTAEHYGQKAYFYQQQGKYFVDISYDQKTETLPITYTFGHYPLQQYLVETETGRFQVLPFAWDARSIDEGGQRWYHNYQNEEIKPADRLHWRQPLQNWNGMCADCHSDGLKRNYDSKENHFDSSFTGINVGCVSCHANMDGHQDNKQSKPVAKGGWQRTAGENTAQWIGDKRDNSFMEQCFSCHALRAPLTDGIDPSKKFLDQFSPQFLQAPMYHVDGQIKEEVYVYGSFLQSKMYANGVNCIDCHDQHTMKIKIPDNGLCLQCHASDVFDKPEHHHHEKDSDGAQCVNCHMPETTYMGVDDRRDHSFKIPRPDLSEKFASPNACTTCHQQQDNKWAVNLLKSWKVKPRVDSETRQNFWRLQQGQSISLEQHLAIVNDEAIDIISRATALQMLGFSTEQLSHLSLKPFITDNEDLLRLAAAGTASLINPGFRAELLSPLLNDDLAAIRIAAARSLLDVYIPDSDKPSFKSALNELIVANEQSGWRGEGRLNQGMVAMGQEDLLGAEKSYLKAISVDPYFDSAYSNLAELYRTQGKTNQVVAVYNKAIKNIPTSALLHYGYGLHFVRQQQLNKAIPLFKKSMALSPQDQQYAYIYALAIDGTGDTVKAIELLRDMVNAYGQNQQLVELGLSLSQKANSRVDFDYFMALR